MNTLVAGTTLLLALLLPSAARADEEEAEACLRSKVWDGYAEGWAIRTMTSTSLPDGGTRNYLVTLYAGNEYQVQACADSKSKNLDILLYDLSGNVVTRDTSDDREPKFTFTPTTTGTYYVVLYARELAEPTAQTGVGLAVTYR